MNVENTELDGVLIIDPPTNFQDFRGLMLRFTTKRLYKKMVFTKFHPG